MEEPACKPDPVRGPKTAGDHLSRAGANARRRPVRRAGAAYPAARAGHPRTLPAWPCSGWGLPSRAGRPTRWWALTPPFHPYRRGEPRRRSAFCCASARSPPPGSRQHPALWSPDFPRAEARGRPAGSSSASIPAGPDAFRGRRGGSAVAGEPGVDAFVREPVGLGVALAAHVLVRDRVEPSCLREHLSVQTGRGARSSPGTGPSAGRSAAASRCGAAPGSPRARPHASALRSPPCTRRRCSWPRRAPRRSRPGQRRRGP